ncbi:MAG: beta-glucosidase, partial [Bacteroides cellulosilyticus]
MMRLIIYVMLLLYPFSLLPAASGGKKEKNLSDEELMTLVQKQTFRYFWDYGQGAAQVERSRNRINIAMREKL